MSGRADPLATTVPFLAHRERGPGPLEVVALRRRGPPLLLFTPAAGAPGTRRGTPDPGAAPAPPVVRPPSVRPLAPARGLGGADNNYKTKEGGKPEVSIEEVGGPQLRLHPCRVGSNSPPPFPHCLSAPPVTLRGHPHRPASAPTPPGLLRRGGERRGPDRPGPAQPGVGWREGSIRRRDPRRLGRRTALPPSFPASLRFIPPLWVSGNFPSQARVPRGASCGRRAGGRTATTVAHEVLQERPLRHARRACESCARWSRGGAPGPGVLSTLHPQIHLFNSPLTFTTFRG